MPNRCQVKSLTDALDGTERDSHESLETLHADAQERLVTILDQYLIDLEEGRRVDVRALLEQNADIAEPLAHYLDGLQLVRELSQASPSQVNPSITREVVARELTRPDRPAVASQLGPYVLDEIIGRGAMGIVYHAYDARHQRHVALKVLAFGTTVETSRIDRFRREAKTAAGLDHPNVVPVYAVGCEAGVNYYAMQLIEGASLDRRLQISQWASTADCKNDSSESAHNLAAPLLGPDRYRRIAQLGATAANALDAVHRAGIIHRDVKPSNLLLGNDGQLWVTDFGLARVQTENALTQAGELIGTVRYMSPEQARGHGDMIDARTDVYGLGATLYEVVTGRAPFLGEDMIDLLRQIQTTEPVPPQQLDPNLPRDFETIICRAMRPRASERYPTAAAMAEDLRRFAEGKPILAHSVTLTERWLGWTLKHRKLAASLLALGTSVMAVSLLSTGLLMQANARTSAALQQSEEHYRQARNIVDTLGSSVAKRLASIPAAENVRQEVLEETIQYYEQFIATSAHDPRLLHDVVRTRLEIARLTSLSDSYEAAETAYWEVLKPFAGELNLEPLKAASQAPRQPIRVAKNLFSGATAELLLCIQAINEWGLLASEHGQQLLAQQRFLAALHCLTGHGPDQPSERSQLVLAQALTLNNLAVAKLRLSQPNESAQYLQQAIGLLQELPVELFRTEELGRDVADAFSNLSVLLGDAQQFVAATQAAEQSLSIRRQSHPTQWVQYQSRTAITFNNLAAVHWKAGRTDDAIDAYRHAADLLEQAMRRAPSRIDTQQRLAVTLNNLGLALATQRAANTRHPSLASHYQEVEQVFARAAALAEHAVAADPGDAEAVRRLAGIENNWAVYLRQQQRYTEADQRLQKAAALVQSLPAGTANSRDAQVVRKIELNLYHSP